MRYGLGVFAAFVMGAVAWAGEAATNPAAPELPEPPRIFLKTEYPAAPGRVIQVKGGQDLQAALREAKPGDTVAVEAGATFKGNFVLPRKAGEGWIVIRSATPDDQLPAPGTRMTPEHAPKLPKLVSPNSMPALRTEPSAHHYRLVALEITLQPEVPLNYGLLALGDGSAEQDQLDEIPTDLVVDRCYIHGNPGQDLIRGIALNSAHTAIVESWVSECHGVGRETQAICGWNGSGPYRITNNRLEGATENVMFGGARAAVTDLVPSDIEFRGNHLFKPRSWRQEDPSFAGKRYSVKNLFELKNARRVLVQDNLMENNWLHAQNGFAILFTVRTEDGKMPWAAVEDVAFVGNVIRHSASGFNILGTDDNGLGRTRRILIRDNYLLDIDARAWGRGSGGLFQILSAADSIVIDHNTALGTSAVIIADGKPSTRIAFTNNIVTYGDRGIVGSGQAPGLGAVQHYFPDGTFQRNAFIAPPANFRPDRYPADQFYPASLEAVGFINAAAGDYRLAAVSPFRTSSTDGKPLGAAPRQGGRRPASPAR